MIQTRGIEQMSEAMTEMDKITQQNAANSEESSSASGYINQPRVSAVPHMHQAETAGRGLQPRPAHHGSIKTDSYDLSLMHMAQRHPGFSKSPAV